MRGRMKDTTGLWDVGGMGRRRRGRDGGRFAECQAECQAECHGGSAARSVRHVTEIWSRRQRKASPSDEATAGERHERRHSDSADAGAGRTRGTKESGRVNFFSSRHHGHFTSPLFAKHFAHPHRYIKRIIITRAR